MPGNDTAALVVALSAQLTKFQKDMDAANGIADKGVRQIENRFAKMNQNVLGGLKTFAAGFVGALSLERIVTGVQRAVHDLAEIGDIAARIDVTTEALQSLRFVVGQNGGEARDADNALQKFADTLGEAAVGSTFLGKLFQANNIALRDQAGNLRAIDDMLGEFAKLVAGAGSAQEKMMLVTEAFGRRAGPQMLLALEEISRKGLPGLIEASKDAGVVIEDHLIQKARDFDDAWEKAMTKAGVEVKSFLITALQEANQLLKDLFEEMQDIAGVTLIPKRSGEPAEDGGPLKVKVGGTKIPVKEKSAFDKEVESIQKHISVMEADAAAVGLAAGEHERLRVVAQLTQVLLTNGVEINEAYRAKIDEIAAAAANAADTLENRKHVFTEMMEASREMGSALADAFKSAALEGKRLDEVMANLIKRMASRSIDKLFDMAASAAGKSLFSSFGGGGGGDFPIFAPGMAEGGDVHPGKAYVVGERGSELFLPKSAGTIVPNHAIARKGSGGGAASIVINNFTGEPVQTRQNAGPGGDVTEIMIGVMNRHIASGGADGAMGRFGLRPSVARR